jgi:hypothetical protein
VIVSVSPDLSWLAFAIVITVSSPDLFLMLIVRLLLSSTLDAIVKFDASLPPKRSVTLIGDFSVLSLSRFALAVSTFA